MYEDLALVALFAFVYSVVAGRLERTAVNGPVVYLLFGVLAGPLGLGLLELPLSGEGIRTIAELTLALVLFTDASNANLGVLRRTFHLRSDLNVESGLNDGICVRTPNSSSAGSDRAVSPASCSS